MEKTIYLIRHSGPFVSYENEDNMSWDEFNKNMILSPLGEAKAKNLCMIKELNGINNIYSSNSARAIATAKYVAEMNNTKIILDNRINERKFGIERISDLPEKFVYNQFLNKDLKYKSGESLNEVSKRFNSFINEILDNGSNKNILFVHGIVLMNFLSELTEFKFDGNNFIIKYKDEYILNGKMKNPDIFKLVFDDSNKLIKLENI